MRPKIKHSLAVILSAFALSLLVACSSQGGHPLEPAGASLCLNIATIGQSRAGVESLSDNEKMQTLRVIVLHADGKVEHNRLYSLSGSGSESKLILLKVTPDEKKKILLFANENSVGSVEGVEGETSVSTETLGAFFGKYPEGTGGFENAVRGLYFNPVYWDSAEEEFLPIPMSSEYVLEMGKGSVERTFYVVRVATKFTINFENWRDEDVIVSDLRIVRPADRNYLMAHVNDFPDSDSYPGWIDWLKEVSEKSSENDTEAASWMMNYDLPGVAKHEVYTHGGTLTVKELDKTDMVFYLPESKNLKESEVTHGEQEYMLSFKVTGREEPFSFALPNLKALFRNTHVVINIAMYTDRVLFRISVEPWDFGGRTEIDVS